MEDAADETEPFDETDPIVFVGDGVCVDRVCHEYLEEPKLSCVPWLDFETCLISVVGFCLGDLGDFGDVESGSPDHVAMEGATDQVFCSGAPDQLSVTASSSLGGAMA